MRDCSFNSLIGLRSNHKLMLRRQSVLHSIIHFFSGYDDCNLDHHPIDVSNESIIAKTDRLFELRDWNVLYKMSTCGRILLKKSKKKRKLLLSSNDDRPAASRIDLSSKCNSI